MQMQLRMNGNVKLGGNKNRRVSSINNNQQSSDNIREAIQSNLRSVNFAANRNADIVRRASVLSDAGDIVGKLAAVHKDSSNQLAGELSEDFDNSQPSWYENLSTQFLFGSLWFCWVLVGTVFYTHLLDIGWFKGFYMAINVGYSVGWGDISESGHSTVIWFSIFYVLAGSSFVAAALGFFAQSIVDDRDNWYTNELQRIAHDQFCEKHKDNIFLLVKGWILYNAEKVRAVVLWCVVVTIATLCALYFNHEFSAAEALYFSISAMSTGGLYTLPPDSEDWNYFVLGVYTALGVPLMAISMATIAAFFITGDKLETTFLQVQEPITEEELKMLTDFEIANDDGIIDKAEFIILCMVRIGAASPQLIRKIVEYYDELDTDGDGGLRPDEIMAGNRSLDRSNYTRDDNCSPIDSGKTGVISKSMWNKVRAIIPLNTPLIKVFPGKVGDGLPDKGTESRDDAAESGVVVPFIAALAEDNNEDSLSSEDEDENDLRMADIP